MTRFDSGLADQNKKFFQKDRVSVRTRTDFDDNTRFPSHVDVLRTWTFRLLQMVDLEMTCDGLGP